MTGLTAVIALTGPGPTPAFHVAGGGLSISRWTWSSFTTWRGRLALSDTWA